MRQETPRVGTLRLITRSLALMLALGATSLFSACDTPKNEGRFPVCKSNDDCQADAGQGPVCFNLRCVECRYDTDCKPGSYCSDSQQCHSLAAPVAEETGPKGWEPNNVDECIKSCKDKDCVDTCAARFPDKPTKKRGR